jgi:hypothetical protein
MPGPQRASDGGRLLRPMFSFLVKGRLLLVMANHHGATKAAPGFIIATRCCNDARAVQ